jgi:hypothetical protein
MANVSKARKPATAPSTESAPQTETGSVPATEPVPAPVPQSAPTPAPETATANPATEKARAPRKVIDVTKFDWTELPPAQAVEYSRTAPRPSFNPERDTPEPIKMRVRSSLLQGKWSEQLCSTPEQAEAFYVAMKKYVQGTGYTLRGTIDKNNPLRVVYLVKPKEHRPRKPAESANKPAESANKPAESANKPAESDVKSDADTTRETAPDTGTDKEVSPGF